MKIFKNKKNEEVEPVNKNIERENRTTYFYAIIFLIILLFALISKSVSKGEDKPVTPSNDEINNVEEKSSLLDVLKENNFDMKLLVFANNNITEYLIRRESENKELIYKSYNDKGNVYYKNDGTLYELSNGKATITNVNIFDDVTKTFLDINNINKLIANKTYELDLTEEEYDIKRYKIEVSRVITIFNEYNRKDIKKSVSGESILDINYSKNELKAIKLDLTSLYKNLNYDDEKVIYYYEFSNYNEIDISSILNLPAE